MGVNNLWKALGNAVQTLEGHNAGQHSEIVEAVENKVVAVDLSAWLMQAQSQPALLEHYDSPYARAAKVVFDRTIHWLRYGCLPVFVIEGQTPAAKLEKLRQRCLAQYGPTARSYDVGNRAGGQFDRLGQAMKRLLDAFGVPCVQAAGEGEAMCAALNLCGWAHACHTLDVDVLLFGALTVYRQMHLQTDDPRKSSLVRCCRSDVQRLLGISRGGEAALQCIAQLAGGDYDTTGAEQVGEGMAMDAVRHLLRGCEDDEAVLQKLEAALAAGPDPELDVLTKCTGCKACGHEGGMKSRIAQHSKRSGGCTGCGCDSGCVPRQWQQCECNFHRRAGERLLNRVVRRAVQTPGFMNSCRTAAATYTSELHKAVAAVQREYSLPVPGSSRNVFTWRARPDVAAIADIMTKYIKEWDHNQVRLKLLPLLLEWDMRQGPQPGPSAGVQFRPTGIRKVSSKGAEDMSGVPARQQQGWRYVLLVERLQQQHAPGADEGAEAEELAVDLAWIAGTARSRPPKLTSASAAAPSSAGAAAWDDGDADGDLCLSQLAASQGPSFSCSQAAPASQAAGSGGGRSGGSLQFSEHRSVRCSLVEAVWPELVAAYRNPPASSARARSAGRKKAAGADGAAAAAAAGTAADKQRNLKDFFNTVKDYTAAAKPSSKPGGRRPAAAGGSIPGLAGIAVGSSSAGAGAAAAAAAVDSGPPAGLLAGRSLQMPAVAAAAAGAVGASTSGGGAAAAGAGGWASSTTKKQPFKKSFTDWLDTMSEEDEHEEHNQQQQQQDEQQRQQLEDLPQSQHDPWGYGQPPAADQPHVTAAEAAGGQASRPAAAAAAADTGQGAHRVFVGMRGGNISSAGAQPSTARAATAAAAAAESVGAGRTPAAAGRTPGRGRGRGSAKQVMRVGALERFLQPTAPVVLSDSDCSSQGQQQRQQHESSAAPAAALDEIKQEQLQQQHAPASSPLKRHPADAIDCTSDSPEMLPLAARLQANKSKLGPAGNAAADAAVAAGAAACGTGMAPPAKKASTDRAKELLASPPTPSSQQYQQPHSNSAAGAAAAGAAGDSRLTAQFAALLDEAGVLSPVPQRQQAGSAAERTRPRSAAKELFAARPPSSIQQQQQQDVIELLDSPADAGGLHRQRLDAGVMLTGGVGVDEEDDVVDLT